MTRTYELGFVVEPRQSDEEVQALTDKYKEMIVAAGAEVTYEDHWGKRKLAYPIEKYTEGKYVFLYISANGTVPPFPEIERLMGQNDKVLRFLTVRTDEGIKRAMRKGKIKPHIPGQEEEAEPAVEETDKADESQES